VVTVRRVVSVLVLLILALLLYTAWQIWRVERDLSRAQSSGERLIDATRDDDRPARNRALSEFLLTTKAAHDRTDGPLWGALTHVPVFGDDAQGVQALSESLNTVAAGGVEPLVDTVDGLDSVSSGGRVDLAKVTELQAPVARSRVAFRSGYDAVKDLDSSGYAGPLKERFNTYVDKVGELSHALGSAQKATEVLPGFLGEDGPRNYLLVFQNNAEIRTTGGLPGSWAEVHAEDGKLEIVRQGTGTEFSRRDTPVLPLTPGELEVYSDLLGVYFQDANFSTNFSRAAELMSARWQEKYPDRLDGVMSLDPVALSYLLEGTGPVSVDDVRLTPANAVAELLNTPYLELSQADQDTFFAKAARNIFNAARGDLQSPLDLVRGLSRAADEGRFLISSFDSGEAETLAGTQVIGDLPDDDGTSPHVFIGLNDATGSKMSYYLRYRADVDARSCADHRQTMLGSMSLNQTIAAAAAKKLPDSVTGRGEFGTERGSQLVAVRIYGPTSGDISDVKVDGAAVDVAPVQLDNRPVVTVVALLSGPDDVVVSWSMESGPGQEGDGTLGVTPSVVPGAKSVSFQGAC
jgi:hypothetical protein